MNRKSDTSSGASLAVLVFAALCVLLIPYQALAEIGPYTIAPLALKTDSELPTVRAYNYNTYFYSDPPFAFIPEGLNNAGQISGNFKLAVPGSYAGGAPYLMDSTGEMIFIDTDNESYPGIATRVSESGEVPVYRLPYQMDGIVTEGMAIWHDGNFTLLDIPDSNFFNNKALDLNESGLVIGKTLGNGWVTDLINENFYEIFPFELSSKQYTEVAAINSQGKVVGSSPFYIVPPPYPVETRHAFIWDASSGITDLGSLGDAYERSVAYGVNDHDQVVGTSNNGETYIVPGLGYRYAVNKAFLWEEGVMTDLGSLEGYQFSEAVDINNQGQVVGIAKKFWVDRYNYLRSAWDGFFWENGSPVSLESLLPEGHGWSTMLPIAINDNGVIVGEGYYGLTKRGFIMSPPGGDLSVDMDDSPDPLILGERLTYSMDIFNHGPSSTAGVEIVDVLPADTYLISSTANCQEADGMVNCGLGSLAAGDGASLALEVEPASAGTLLNTVTAAGSEVDPDPSNNTSFENTQVLTPAQAVRYLQQMILNCNLHQGLNNSLDVKLKAVLNALEAINAGQRQDASNKLQAFLNEVEAQRGQEITDQQADELIGFAARIIAVL